jgi:hypothetical protein
MEGKEEQTGLHLRRGKQTSPPVGSRRRTMACPDRFSLWKQDASSAFAQVSPAPCGGRVCGSAGGSSRSHALPCAALPTAERKAPGGLPAFANAVSGSRTDNGKKRRAWDVAGCLAPLLRWVVRWIPVKPGAKRWVAPAWDATSVRKPWTILGVRVLGAGSAISVAWKGLPARQRGSDLGRSGGLRGGSRSCGSTRELRPARETARCVLAGAMRCLPGKPLGGPEEVRCQQMEPCAGDRSNSSRSTPPGYRGVFSL